MGENQEEGEAQNNEVVKIAAVQLAEIKDIAPKKILSGDFSVNFGPGWVPESVKSFVEEVGSVVSEVTPSTETAPAIVDKIAEDAEKVIDVVTDTIEGVIDQ